MIKMNDANSSTKSKEAKHLSHDLKINEVELRHKVKIANGDISINTFSRIYLTE